MTQEVMLAVESDSPVAMTVAEDSPVAMRTMEYIAGGGVTSDYEALTNKPSINGTELVGNKTTAELGLSPPVTSVNGQTGAVSISIPSSAADVGAVSATQGAANANKFLVTDNSGNVTTRTLDTWSGGNF